jgi:hypothetical protein
MPRQPQRCNIIHITVPWQGRILELADQKDRLLVSCLYLVAYDGSALALVPGRVCNIMPEVVPGIEAEAKPGTESVNVYV